MARPAPHAAVGSSLFDLSGRTALVTGGSRGIGWGAAQALDAAGAQVVLCGRDLAALRDASGALDNDPIAVRGDLAEPDGATELLGRVAELVDGVDILVNNAGVHLPAPAAELELDAWDQVLDVNLRSAFALAQGVARGMRERGGGKIINVASILGLLGDTHAVAYVASKAALLGMTRALAVEWAAGGITVNALCPGWIETDMVAGLRASATFDRRVTRRTPVGRWGRPDDLAGAFVFLAAPASDFVTGQALVVDGGLTAGW
jgi:NAD(P)-dependent dehydrogenase (short-subunit alcohol dehydrogenase family)